MNIYRQGDVLIRQVVKLPKGASAVQNEDRIVLAHGEVTGHAHAVAVEEATEYSMADAAGAVRRFLTVASSATVMHEEHAAIPLPAGVYEIVHESINAPGFERLLTPDEALAAVDALNEQSWAGFNDWSLPDVMEAQRPVDRSRYNPACDTSVYPDAQSDWYWTGVETPWSRKEKRTGASRSFFVVDVTYGYVYGSYAGNRSRVRPVRRGGAVPAGQ